MPKQALSLCTTDCDRPFTVVTVSLHKKVDARTNVCFFPGYPDSQKSPVMTVSIMLRYQEKRLLSSSHVAQ